MLSCRCRILALFSVVAVVYISGLAYFVPRFLSNSYRHTLLQMFGHSLWSFRGFLHVFLGSQSKCAWLIISGIPQISCASSALSPVPLTPVSFSERSHALSYPVARLAALHVLRPLNSTFDHT